MPPYYACVRNTNTETQTGTNAGPRAWARAARVPPAREPGLLADFIVVTRGASQSVSYFTVPPRAHPSTGSQSGSVQVHAPAAYGIISHPAAPRKRTYLRIRT